LPITKTSTIASYTYGIGPTGDHQSLTEMGGRAVAYTYDGIYRLTNETIGFDPNGKNRSVGYGRCFNPLTGRFLTRDPNIGSVRNPATLHKHLYSGADRVNHVDPTGLDFIEVAIQNAKVSEELRDLALAAYLAVRIHCYAAAIVTVWAAPFTGLSFNKGPLPWYLTWPCSVLALQKATALMMELS